MQSDEQIIVSLIRLMKTDQVVMAEQKLMQMVDSIEFMNKIFNVIKSKQLEPWVKTIGSSFLNKAIGERLEQFGYKTMFTAISSIMSSYDVASSDKRCFESSIVSLIEYIKEPQEIEEWRKFILSHINDEQLFDTGLLLIDCTAIAQIQIDYLCMIMEDTFELTFEKVFVSLQSAMVINELIKCWIVVFDKLMVIEHEEVVNLLLVKLTTSRTLAKVLFAVFQFSAPSEIWLCVNPELYELNLLKYEAAELTRKVSEYALKHRIPAQQCHCLQIVTQSYTKIKNTIAIVGNSQNLEVMEIYQCEDLITSLLSLLVVYVKVVKDHSVQQMNVLQHIVCYPFVKTREQEMYMFEQSPEEFNTLAEDLCDKQTFGILKTEAAKLLEVIADSCRQAMEKSIIFCVESIKISMGYVPKYESNQVKILDIQTAFQLLAVYSFSLQQYPSHLESLKVILCDNRMMDLTPLALSKVFLFLAYNYQEVFKSPIDGSFWVDFALTYNKHPTTRYMALDFISNIADQYFTQNFFNQITKLILQSQQRQSGVVWNIVIKIFEAQKQKISQLQSLNLVNIVFKRIEQQFEALQQSRKQSTQDIINALHILRKIVESKEYLSGKKTLKMRILDISVIYNKAISLDLEDEIIKIMTEYVKLDEEVVRDKILQLLPSILEQLKKNQYCQQSYFILLNQLIVKSKFTQVKPIIKTLLSGLMFHLFDMSENAQKRKMKISIANILTLLQNLLSVHGYEMSGTNDDCMCEIGAMAIRLFPSQQDNKIFSKGLLAKALNLMFICHLYSKAENTIDYLIQFGRQNIFQKYDAYVLIKLLSKAVFAQDNINIVIEYLNLMIEVTNEEEKNDRKGLSVKTAKGKLKIKRQEELSDLVYHISSPFINFEYSKSKKQLPIKKEVIECICKMKSHNMETYKIIIMTMNEQKKTKLINIVNQTAEVEGKNRVIRKVIGIKAKGEQIHEDNDNSDVEEETNFKRKRVLMKKNESKKKATEDINVE